ncbi:MAG: glycosyltransferase family 4 protein [Actinobacteria bacterium]|nr:glycosyltransferase family 4 protein [Actinomycetota bacterium]
MASLVNRGVEVSVVTSSRQARTRRWSNIRWIRLGRWDDPIPIALARGIKQSAQSVLRAPKSSFSLLRAAQSRHGWWRGLSVALRTQLPLLCLEGDVIHFEWNLTAVQYLSLFPLWRRPIVISCRGSQINVPITMTNSQEIELGIRTSFQMATAVHCVSEAIAKEAEKYGLNREKTWVIPPAVDTSFFRPPESRAREYTTLQLVTTGSLVWQKGYEYCLMAIKRLTDLGIRSELHIIGDGPERQRVLFTIADLGLEDYVHLHGHLQPNDLRALLWDCDAFILASVTEGISNAALEAMACGLPVVVTDTGGMRDLVRDGIDGYLVPPRDPEALARSVERLKHPQVRLLLGKAARTRIEQSFSLNAQTDRFVELYDSVLAGWEPAG